MKRVLVALALAACGAGSGSPDGAVRALAEAAQAGDRAAAWALLGPETRARLTEDARRAAAMAGGLRIEPQEMLAVGWFAPKLIFDGARVVEKAGARAVVEVRGKNGERERVTCVREGGAWRVELP